MTFPPHLNYYGWNEKGNEYPANSLSGSYFLWLYTDYRNTDTVNYDCGDFNQNCHRTNEYRHCISGDGYNNSRNGYNFSYHCDNAADNGHDNHNQDQQHSGYLNPDDNYKEHGNYVIYSHFHGDYRFIDSNYDRPACHDDPNHPVPANLKNIPLDI